MTEHIADRFAAGWSSRDPERFAGIAPTGRAFAFRGASLLELDGDAISHCVDYWDLAHLVRVLR